MSDLEKVRQVMRSGEWLTPMEIVERTGVGALSVTARIRDLRKKRHGGAVVDVRTEKVGVKRVYWYRMFERNHEGH